MLAYVEIKDSVGNVLKEGDKVGWCNKSPNKPVIYQGVIQHLSSQSGRLVLRIARRNAFKDMFENDDVSVIEDVNSHLCLIERNS